MNQEAKPIIVEQTFNSPIQVVWDALTKEEQMKQWFFPNIPSFKPEIGFQTEFGVESGNRRFTHLWKIVEVIPCRKITYHWSYKEYEGEGIVSFELFEKDGQTLLRVSNMGMESFPNNIPEFRRESCQSGWEYFIQGNLKSFMEKPEGRTES